LCCRNSIQQCLASGKFKSFLAFQEICHFEPGELGHYIIYVCRARNLSL
jgi:hypothetical protein